MKWRRDSIIKEKEEELMILRGERCNNWDQKKTPVVGNQKMKSEGKEKNKREGEEEGERRIIEE